MNDFREDLSFSLAAESLPMWEEIYGQAFPGYQSINNARGNGELQMHGIDRVIVLNSGKVIYVDEKIRRKSYGDILLEYEANDVKHSAGWVEKPLFCDYIAYAILPDSVCYLLPVPQLQKVWAENKGLWLRMYGRISAINRYYNTLSCPVPADVLFRALGQALRVEFNANTGMI